MSFESVSIARLKLWLDGPTGRGYEGALGAAEDTSFALDKEARKLLFARTGCIATTDVEGLRHAGELRELPRAPNETGVKYLGRLARAHEIWHWSGTGAGMSQAFEPFDLGFIGAYHELVHLDPERDSDLIARQKSLGHASPELWLLHHPPAAARLQIWDYASLGGPWWVGGDSKHPWWTKLVFVFDSRSGPWGRIGTWGDLDAMGLTVNEFDKKHWLYGTTMTDADAMFIRRMVMRFKHWRDYPLHVAVVLKSSYKGIAGFDPPGLETWGALDALNLTVGDIDDDEVFVLFFRILTSWADHLLWGLEEQTWGQPIDMTIQVGGHDNG